MREDDDYRDDSQSLKGKLRQFNSLFSFKNALLQMFFKTCVVVIFGLENKDKDLQIEKDK